MSNSNYNPRWWQFAFATAFLCLLTTCVGCRTGLDGAGSAFTEADAYQVGKLAALLYLVERGELDPEDRAAIEIGYAAFASAVGAFASEEPGQWDAMLVQVLGQVIDDPAKCALASLAISTALDRVSSRMEPTAETEQVLAYLQAAIRGADDAVASTQRE